MFVPKEIAPYLGMIAPMVAPQLGIVGSLALSQLGSFKQHGGKFDPFSAVATGIALASPQARAIRAAGRAGGQGTIGQQVSAGISESLGKMSTDPKSFTSTLARGFDPTQAMSASTAGGHGSYFENPFYAELDKFGKYTAPDGTVVELTDASKAGIASGDMRLQDYGTDEKQLKELLGHTHDAKYGVKATETELREIYGDDVYDKFTGDELAAAQDINRTGGTLKDAGFFTKAGEFGSNLAGGILPGFGEYDPLTGAYTGKFDFGKALQTVSVAGTLGSLKAIGEELKKQKQLDEQKQREIWTTYFKSYERAAGKPYSQSRYPDANIMEKFNRFMLATGGRVGYNLGGLTEPVGIMGSSGVPQGMQVDGRNGTFIPMGVEEKADDVPAMLSKNEFVMTADAVKAAGDGDANVGAQRMYDLMHNLEAQV